jgi:hypothetical protein
MATSKMLYSISILKEVAIWRKGKLNRYKWGIFDRR